MYKPSITDWPNDHRKLLLAFLTAVGLAVAVMLILVWPHRKQFQKEQREYQRLLSEINQKRWPADPSVLNSQLRLCKKILEGTKLAEDNVDEEYGNTLGLLERYDHALTLATGNFLDDIQKLYPDVEKDEVMNFFVTNASRIDYQFVASQIDNQLKTCNSALPTSLATLDVKISEPIYQKLLHLWTLQAVIQTAIDNKLDFLQDAETKTALVSLLPSTAYTVLPSDEKPYLLEFPVQITLAGTIDQALKFMHDLQHDGQFIPVKNFSINTTPPDKFSPGQTLILERQTFTFICTSFALPEECFINNQNTEVDVSDAEETTSLILPSNGERTTKISP